MNEDFTELSSHAAVLRRRGWIIVLVALLGAVAGALVAPLAPSTSTAESRVLVPLPPTSSDTAVVDTQVEVVTSDRVIQAALTTLAGLGETTDASSLLDSLTVAVVPDTAAISITATRPTPQQAARAANVVADSYVQVYAQDLLDRRNSVVDSLGQQLDEASAKLVALNEQRAGLSGVDLLETKAALARQQQRQARLVDRLAEAQDPTTAASPASILTEAVAPSSDTASVAALLRPALFGLVLGLVLGLLLAYARHSADDRIVEEDELVALAGRTPILGRIPRVSKGRRGGGALADPSSKTAEAFRGLAVNLRLRVEHPSSASSGSTAGVTNASSHAAAGAGVMALIVSGSPGEGKSSVAGDLAVTAAGMGLRVTLVDADLRKPRLASRFDAAPEPGLTDALQRPVTMPQPVEVGIDNLRLLPAGAMHADPATLLSAANQTDLWERLREENDLVVVDSAPALYAAETLELATLADRVVLVVERGRTKRRDLRTVLERMELVGVRPAGTVFTKVPPKQVVGGYYPGRS